VDLNQNLLSVGKSRGRLKQAHIGDARHSGLPGGTADVVTAFEFLEHLEDPEVVVGEMHRILRSGGHAVVSVPYDTWISLWRPLFAGQILLQGYLLGNRYYRRKCGHIQHFSPASLANLFVRVGFSIELVFHMRRMTIFLVAHKDGPRQPIHQCSDLTIVLPTLNEGNSLGRMLEFLTGHYPGARIMVADDGSVDRTKEIALSFSDHNVMFLDRSGEPIHGLTASVLDAVARAETPFVVVLDADGQHPPQKVMEVLNLLRLGSNLVVGSRVQVEGDWPLDRKLLSYLGTALGKISLIARGKSFLSYDILSGFFGLRRPFFQSVIQDRTANFRLRGYKVLFDLLKLLPKTEEAEEVYYRFETRQGGRSKQTLRVYREYLKSVFT
jgi:hypothetical protein